MKLSGFIQQMKSFGVSAQIGSREVRGLSRGKVPQGSSGLCRVPQGSARAGQLCGKVQQVA